MGDLGTARRTVLAAHPFKAGPNRVDKAVLRVAEKAPHRLVLAPGVLFRPISALPPSEGRPEGSPHPSQCLRGLKPDPSQRGQSSPSCRGHSNSSGDPCAERAKLISAIRTSFPGGRASGCSTTAGAASFPNLFILASLMSLVYIFD